MTKYRVVVTVQGHSRWDETRVVEASSTEEADQLAKAGHGELIDEELVRDDRERSVSVEAEEVS